MRLIGAVAWRMILENKTPTKKQMMGFVSVYPVCRTYRPDLGYEHRKKTMQN